MVLELVLEIGALRETRWRSFAVRDGTGQHDCASDFDVTSLALNIFASFDRNGWKLNLYHEMNQFRKKVEKSIELTVSINPKGGEVVVVLSDLGMTRTISSAA